VAVRVHGLGHVAGIVVAFAADVAVGVRRLRLVAGGS